MTFWLGNPGALAALPHPRKGLDPTAVRPASVAQTIGGGQVVGFAPGARRTYQLSWSGLTTEQYTVIEEFFAGLRGRGPFTLLDPGRRNKLSANQSGAGSASYDGTGWTTLSTAETVSAAASPVLRGPRSLRWSIPTTGVTAGLLRPAPPTGLAGIPAPAGQPWTWSCWLRGGGIAPSLTATLALLWQDATGAIIGATIGTPTAIVYTGWTQLTVTAAAPPAGAQAVLAEIRADLTTIGGQWSGFGDAPLRSGWLSPRALRAQAIGTPLDTAMTAYAWPGATADLYVDQPQLEMAATAGTWVAGTGVPRVSVTHVPELYRTLPFHTAAATLVEVG